MLRHFLLNCPSAAYGLPSRTIHISYRHDLDSRDSSGRPT